ncbi:uncharacterized protein LOC127257297 [Andrographis paniculata]|uniref:uncharacterized protein LOC127257297 n=1 Tax=Andrographis paniculata TaxID=175694 RepID=UPI0021E85479|nr:uncharacterized protein LOC127257297 [Andrographis paniculata]
MVICKVDLLRYLLNRPVLRGRLVKWALKLTSFSLTYQPLKAVKGQAIADFLAEHPRMVQATAIDYVGVEPWTVAFDGSSTIGVAGAGVIIHNPEGEVWRFAHQLPQGVTNNQAEYEALLLALRFLVARKVRKVVICGDSQLVIRQALKEFKCRDPQLQILLREVHSLLQQLTDVVLEDILRDENAEANDLEQWASGFRRRYMPWEGKCSQVDRPGLDWRTPLLEGLANPRKATTKAE